MPACQDDRILGTILLYCSTYSSGLKTVPVHAVQVACTALSKSRRLYLRQQRRAALELVVFAVFSISRRAQALQATTIDMDKIFNT